TNLDGLSSLTSIHGYLKLQGNDGLTNIDGLYSLTNIDGDVLFYDNSHLCRSKVNVLIAGVRVSGTVYRVGNDNNC
ncbi:MAG: hypothetical protein HN348_29045, partial [Proteobacteria bacterium]|nr:hypothetical protein [Pseudomonadota bacterium]